MRIDLELTEQLQNKLNNKLKEEDLTSSEYLLKLIEQDINSTIELGNGFYYNKYLSKFFNKENKEIKLTKTQKNLILALIQSNGNIVSAEDLIIKAWSSRGNVSIYTLRNMIKQIRDKTYYELIVNHSNKGYTVNLKGNL